MNTDAQTARDDLAFMRGVAEAGGDVQRPFGQAYLAAGVIYGAQMLLHAGQFFGLIPVAGILALAVGIGPTVVFLFILWRILRRARGARPPGIVARATNSVFAAVGCANLALVVVIGSVALRRNSFEVWFIYPCAVFILQGAAWLVAFSLRRRAWLLWVGLGWFAAAIAMGFSIGATGWYIAIAGLSLIFLMALPGAALIALSRRASA